MKDDIRVRHIQLEPILTRRSFLSGMALAAAGGLETRDASEARPPTAASAAPARIASTRNGATIIGRTAGT
jgi:hypothetical protein